MEFISSHHSVPTSCAFSAGSTDGSSGVLSTANPTTSPSGQTIIPSISTVNNLIQQEISVSTSSPMSDKEIHSVQPELSQLSLKCGEEVSESLEYALDNLASYLNSSFSLSGEMHERMATYLRSNDVNLRLEATQAYRRSLSQRQDLEKKSSSLCHQEASCRHDTKHLSIITENFQFDNTCASGNIAIGTPLLDITIEDMIRAKLIPHIIKSLSLPHPHLQLESVFLIQRLCRGTPEQTKQIVSGMLVAALVHLLENLNLNQPGGSELRIAVLSLISKLPEEFKPLKEPTMQSLLVISAVLHAAELQLDLEGVRCVQALVVSNVFTHPSTVKPLLNYLRQILKGCQDSNILCVACNACVTLCEQQEGVSLVVDSEEIIPRIIQLSRHSDQKVVFDALSVIAKIAFVGTTSDIDKIIEMGVVPAMVEVLQDPNVSNSTTRARTCNAIGNIGCETPKQVQSIIDSQALPLLMDIFMHDPDYNTRTEAAYSVCTCVSRSCPAQVWYIISCSSRPLSFPRAEVKPSRTNNLSVLSFEGSNPCLQLIADMLEMVCGSDPTNSSSLKLCKAILRGLDNILSVGINEGKRLGLAENPYATMFHEVQGDLKLSQMQFFPDYSIAAKTHMILEKYFSTTAIWSSKG